MKLLYILFISIILFSCSNQNDSVIIINVKNDLSFDRIYETVEVDVSHLNLSEKELFVFDAEKSEQITSQLVDNDLDDHICFKKKEFNIYVDNISIDFLKGSLVDYVAVSYTHLTLPTT